MPKALVRTLNPMIVGFLASIGLLQFLAIDDIQAAAAVTVVLQAFWYIAIKVLERFFPKAGVLLGWVGEPTYEAKHIAP